MTFFSGFALQNEAEQFAPILGDFMANPYVVAGFSRGAIEAVAYTAAQKRRIDRLILLSPAWFCDRDEAFKQAQLAAFRKNRERYLTRFYREAAKPCAIDWQNSAAPAAEEALRQLLYHDWPEATLQAVQARGVMIETHLAQDDRIVNASAAAPFFRQFGTLFLYKKGGHPLCASQS